MDENRTCDIRWNHYVTIIIVVTGGIDIIASNIKENTHKDNMCMYVE